MEQRTRARGWQQRFVGVRVNCELVPCLPAGVVRALFQDPRNVPYLLIWQDRWGEVKETVRLARRSPPLGRSGDWVEIKRANGGRYEQGIDFRNLPRNGGRALFFVCGHCDRLCRFLYAWEADGRSNRVRYAYWPCRSCARLSYASEGRALRISLGAIGLSGCYDYSPRPDPWMPYVFSNPEQRSPIDFPGVDNLHSTCDTVGRSH